MDGPMDEQTPSFTDAKDASRKDDFFKSLQFLIKPELDHDSVQNKGKLRNNKADRHKSRAPSLQRQTDRQTDRPTNRRTEWLIESRACDKLDILVCSLILDVVELSRFITLDVRGDYDNFVLQD